MDCLIHKDDISSLASAYANFETYLCPYCEIDRLRMELEKIVKKLIIERNALEITVEKINNLNKVFNMYGVNTTTEFYRNKAAR